MLKLEGIKTFLWLEELDKKEANPSGVSRSKLIKTGLHVYPEFTSTLKREPSGISPDVSEN